MVYITFKKHAAKRTRYIRANQLPFMIKKLLEEIMERCLTDKYLNAKSKTDSRTYNKIKS